VTPTPDASKPASTSGTVALGDLTVHRLGFGAMRITGAGVWGPPDDRPEAIRVLRRAVDLGVTFIDTANSYGPQISETLIAEALAPYPPHLVIGTKGGFERPGPGQWRTNGHPEHLRAELEGSLHRLKLERIDLYQLHRIDPAVPEDDQFGVLQAFQREGKIRHIGLSEVSVDQLARARQSLPVVSVQNRYNVIDRQSEDVVRYCEREGIAFIPWYPLLVGKVGETSSALTALAAAHDANPMQMALAWLLARSPVMLPIPGTSRVDHLEENLAAASIRISAAEFAGLG
jgi:aryl-alcohol dehydrogenase-like predicted oxidoreductase